MASKKLAPASGVTMNAVAEGVGRVLGTATGTTERLVAEGQMAAGAVKDTITADASKAVDVFHDAQARGGAVVKHVKAAVKTARKKTRSAVRTTKSTISAASTSARKAVAKGSKAFGKAKAVAKKTVAKVAGRGAARAKGRRATTGKHNKNKKTKSRGR